VLELFQEKGLFSIPVKRLGIPDTFVEHGPQALLREKYGIDEKGIFKGVEAMFEEERSEAPPLSQAEASRGRALTHSK
jgi:1-deoxy-D-xylulose-5-phosphate synthase